MRTLLATLAVLAALPLPADAARLPVRAYVLERVSDDATDPGISGGAGARDHEYAFAAVASVTTSRGRFADATGALFFGVTAESDPEATGPGGATRCSAVPGAREVCGRTVSGAGLAFAVWWEDATFDYVLVAMRGRDQEVRPMEGVRGWRLRPWRGAVREVAGDLAGATASPYGLGSFVDAEAVGGPGGSVAIGHPPCTQVAYASGGAGGVRLLGGTREALGACPATFAPPAAASPGSTEWTLTGAAAGVSDVPVRMVVIEAQARR